MRVRRWESALLSVVLNWTGGGPSDGPLKQSTDRKRLANRNNNQLLYAALLLPADIKSSF